MDKPVAWFKKQPLPIKVVVVVVGLYLVALLLHRATAAPAGTPSGWDPRKFVPGGRWGGL